MSRLIFNPYQLKFDDSACVSGMLYWKDFYGYIEEELPPGMPESLGKSAHTTCSIDSNQYGNFVTQRSHTGVLIYVMNEPIIVFSNN